MIEIRSISPRGMCVVGNVVSYLNMTYTTHHKHTAEFFQGGGAVGNLPECRDMQIFMSLLVILTLDIEIFTNRISFWLDIALLV